MQTIAARYTGNPAACVFLAADGCGFITGQTIHVNGGAAYF